MGAKSTTTSNHPSTPPFGALIGQLIHIMWEVLLYSNDICEYSSAKIIRMAIFDNGNIIVDLNNHWKVRKTACMYEACAATTQEVSLKFTSKGGYKQGRTALHATYANGYTLICNLQIFLGGLPNPPPPFFICNPSPNCFSQKRLHIKKPSGTPLTNIPWKGLKWLKFQW